VAAGACTAGKGNVGAGVDGEAIILVLDVGVGDGDAGRAADVKGVGVVAAVSDVAGGVVDGDVVKCEVGGGVDGEALNGGVLDVEVVDVGLLHGVGVEELTRERKIGNGKAQMLTLGLVLPPLPPLPSHHLGPLPSMTWPVAPLTVMLVPETEIKGPVHSLYAKVVVPWKVT
jgi:hypothetical protein